MKTSINDNFSNETETKHFAKPRLAAVNNTSFAIIYIGFQIVFFGSWYFYAQVFAYFNRKADGSPWTDLGEFMGIWPAFVTTIIFIKIMFWLFRSFNCR